MATDRTCEECGAALPANAPQGLCPRCLVGMGLRLPVAETPPTAGTDPSVPSRFRIAEKPGDRVGRYKLLEEIGEGGFGVVYMAEQVEPVQRKVALKIIKAGMDTREVVARFEAERQALALMDHPNIARALDAGATDAGRPYFVMELVRGSPITDFCDQNHVPTQERLQLFVKVCYAVQHAHQKGVIHRDLKPGNVLVTLHDGEPVPKVIDFGVVKALGQKLTEKTLFTGFHHLIGTPAYMSPEQAELSGLDIDTRADIYSLGVLLYELLTGVTPFDRETLARAALDEIRQMIRETEPPKPSNRLETLGDRLVEVAKRRRTEPATLSRLVRGDLDWIVMKCLEKDRQRRYETANGLAMDLKCHLDHEPVVARPPSNLYRFQRMVRRHRLAFTAASALATALLVGGLASTWQAVRATRAERRARAAEVHAREEAALAERERVRADTERTAAQRNAYSATMLLAQADWDQSNLAHLRNLLAETGSYADRGFEWFYWQRMLHLDARTLRGPFKSVFAVAFSLDGRRLASAGDDHRVRVWAADTGREALIFVGHAGLVSSVAFSPDGRLMVSGSADCTVKVWEAESGRELLTLRGHTGNVDSVAFSPDGRRVASGSGDRTMKVWEVESGRERLTLRGHTGDVESVAFSPDGRWIVSGSADDTAKIWEADSGRGVRTIEAHTGGVRTVAVSPDGRRILTGGGDRTLKVWDAESGGEFLKLSGHTGAIRSAAFSPDGGRIVSGSGDTTIKLWDAETGKELLTFRGHSFEGSAFRGGAWRAEARGPAVAFSPDGQWVVSGSDDGAVKVWAANADPEVLTLRGHTDAVRSIAFSPDGRWLVSGSDDGTLKVWQVDTGLELRTLRGHTAEVSSVSFSPDGRRIASGGRDRSVRVWAADGGRELLTLGGDRDEVCSVAFSPDGRWIAAAGYAGTCRLWDAESGRQLGALEWGEPINEVRFSPDGKRMVGASDYGWLKVWEVASGRELFRVERHDDIIDSVEFSPDGRQLLTASCDVTVKLSDAETGRELRTLRGHAGRPYAAAFSPDGRRIVSGSADRTIRLWETDRGGQLLTLQGHTDRVLTVAFSPDGRRIASSSADQTVRIWTAASPDQVSRWQEAERR